MEHLCSTNEKLNYDAISKMWRIFNKQLDLVQNRVNKSNWQKFGISYNSTGKNFNYIAAVSVSDFEKVPNKFFENLIILQKEF